MHITASRLYSFFQCPHRLWRDLYDNPAHRDSPNEFVELLWEHGIQHEKKLIEEFVASEAEMLDCSVIPKEKRAQATLEALQKKVPYIYHGRLEVDELLGEPDLLELRPDGQYQALDIKSGMGSTEDDNGSEKLKKHYALQLGLYTDALRRLGFADHYEGIIWDSQKERVIYTLSQPMGVRTPMTYWEMYEDILMKARHIFEKSKTTKPALVSICKLCHWYSTCKKECETKNVLSLVPELGRSKQEGLDGIFSTIEDLATMNIEDQVDAKGKTGIPGIGKPTLEKFHRRAKLLNDENSKPLFYEPIIFPDKPIELFFDIEADPTQEIIYLHGVVERKNRDDSTNKFYGFTATEVSLEAEKKAWQEFWDYIRSLNPDDWVMYYYSKYERTQYRVLAQKFPEVATPEEVEWLFEEERAIDLYYDIVKPKTDWPTYNYSVKSLAQYLGFNWRDTNPSGAASIQWFNEWCKDKSSEKLQRILDYNEDDCIAMIVLKYGIEKIQEQK